MERDGNGWIECGRGHRHWGVHGAAGLLLHGVDDSGALRLLLQHRAEWCHHGGTWGLPGGARDSHETVQEAALREAEEETGLDTSLVRTRGTFVDDHGGWTYTTVYADSASLLDTVPNEESAALEWVAAADVGQLPLHPGFSRTWPEVQLSPVTLLIDAANVVGSTPNGWWKDPAAATSTWSETLDQLVATTLVDDDLRAVVTAIHVVLEGRAASATVPLTVTPVRADGSGDDALIDHLAAAAQPTVVVTSDRELRERALRTPRTTVRGPRWLTDLLTGA